ncbi:MAG: hypothetical protein UZ15_CFX003000382 [Chloroflexi bacterium OLB15]|nr:MAG: hypothetical protein UZ15_CFX003000382 [Chloroflexi bacterium OLB15]
MSDPESDLQAIVQRYQQVVLEYEELDQQIDRLLMEYGGASENMPQWELARYRKLARQRDDLQNEMRDLEAQLQLDDSETDSGEIS